MSFENLTDDQVRGVVEATGGFFNTMQVKALLEALNSVTSSGPTTVTWDNVSGKPNATASVRGLVLQGAAVPNAAAAPTKAEFDALVVSLRASGAIAT